MAAVNLFAQVGSITASISNSNNDPLTFIQGSDGFENTLTIENEPAGTVSIWLCILDDQDEIMDSVEASLNGSDWEAVVNMGELDPESVRIEAHYYDSNDDLLDVSYPYLFTIVSEPAAITSELVEISVDDIQDGIASLLITISIPDSSQEVEDAVVGIGGKEFGFEYNNIVLSRDFDMATGTLETTGNSIYEYQLKAFGIDVGSDEIDLNASPNLNVIIDAHFNPIIEGHYSAFRNFFNYNFKDVSLPIPIKPGDISIGAGLSVNGGLSANCYMGLDNNGEFGFIENTSGEMSSVSIGASVKGQVRVTGSLVNKHIAGVEGSLTAIGRIGASYSFKTEPAFEDELKIGGELLLKGKVKLTGLIGKAKQWFCNFSGRCEPNGNVLDGVIWPRNNNDLPFEFGGGLPSGLDTLLPAGMNISYNVNSRSLEIDTDDFYDVPDQSPQPAFANRGSSVAIAWIESDSTTAHLLFSVLDTIQNRFTAPIEVTHSEVYLADPKVAIGPDGSGIIVWTQSKLDITVMDATYDLDSIFNNLEVGYAVYDPVSGAISTKSEIYDTEYLPASNPGIAISDSGKALISWLAQDTSGSTDIWYSELVNGNGIWYQSTPDIINDLPGNNYEVQICFTDSVNAIAAWITDSDGDDSIGGNKIVVSYYDGDSWSTTVDISDASSEEEYNELSMDFNGDYGAIAYTSTTYGEDGEELNSVKAETYYQGQWDEVNYFEFSDSLSFVRMPRISISDKEFAAISYQTMDIYNEDGEADAGEVHMALKDLNAGSNWQDVDFSNQIAQDTSIFVWEMDVVLGRDNKLYTLSQEQDTVSDELGGSNYIPFTGVLFGDPKMGLVLRGLKVNDDLTVDDESLSSLPEVPTGLPDLVSSNKEGLKLIAYPNPFHDEITFSFSIPENGFTKLEILDFMGRTVAKPISGDLRLGDYTTVIHLSNLSQGVYIAKLSNKDKSAIKKLIYK